MNPIGINLAVEDDLSEAVLRRLVEESKRPYSVGVVWGRRGNGYLRETIRGWNQAAKGGPIAVLTDLDRWECPMALKQAWFRHPLHPNLIFRVAVREVEAWLLADREAFAQFFRVSPDVIPRQVELLADPKRSLIEVAKRSPRAIRERVVPRRGSTALQGPDYNGCLSEFVRGKWNLDRAAAAAPSLAKAMARLSTFEPAR